MNYSNLLAVVLVLSATSATAESRDNVEQQARNMIATDTAAESATGGSALVSQLATGSFNLGSMTNVAGVMRYCQQQGYTGDTVDRVKTELMNRIGSSGDINDNPAYSQGASGVLQSAQDHSFTLSGLEQSVGQRACDMIANKAAASFLSDGS